MNTLQLQANFEVILLTVDHYDQIIRRQTDGKFKVAIDSTEEHPPAICSYEFFCFDRNKWRKEMIESEQRITECYLDAIHALAEYNIDATFFSEDGENVLVYWKKDPITPFEHLCCTRIHPAKRNMTRLLESIPPPELSSHPHANFTPQKIVADALNSLACHFFLLPILREMPVDTEDVLPRFDTQFTSPEEFNWNQYYRYIEIYQNWAGNGAAIAPPPISFQEVQNKKEGDRLVITLFTKTIFARCIGSQYFYQSLLGFDFPTCLRNLLNPHSPNIQYCSINRKRMSRQIENARKLLQQADPSSV